MDFNQNVKNTCTCMHMYAPICTCMHLYGHIVSEFTIFKTLFQCIGYCSKIITYSTGRVGLTENVTE